MSTARTALLFIHSSNEMYGADKILLQVIETLPDSEREKVVVWLPDDVPPADNCLADELARREIKYEVKSLPIIRRRYLSLRYSVVLTRSMARLRRDIATMRPRMVYLTTSATLLGACVARLSGVRQIILHCQEIWAHPESLALGALAVPVTSCVCVSDAARDSLSGPVRKRAQVILNGVPDSNRPLVSLEAQTGPLRFLIASRWNGWKGHGTLLEAWDTPTPIGELRIAGGPPEIGQAVDVPRLVADLSHPESVHILGEVKDISSLIDDSDFVIVPSDEPEPFGLVAIEAFARGRAVIASDGGGLADIVESGLSGQLFQPRDSGALRASLLELDRAEACRMGDIARKVFESHYSIHVFALRFGEFWLATLPSLDPPGRRSMTSD